MGVEAAVEGAAVVVGCAPVDWDSSLEMLTSGRHSETRSGWYLLGSG